MKFVCALLGDCYSAMFLLEHSASASSTSPQLGESALHLIANQSSASNPFQDEDEDQCQMPDDMIKVARKLIDCGLNANLQNSKG
jgi:hypothetical protein